MLARSLGFSGVSEEDKKALLSRAKLSEPHFTCAHSQHTAPLLAQAPTRLCAHLPAALPRAVCVVMVRLLADDEWNFSHLLVDEEHPRRSAKVLHAIASGVWVLSHRWLLDAQMQEDGSHVWQPPTGGDEEQYEAKQCWPGAGKSRAQAQLHQQNGSQQRSHHSHPHPALGGVATASPLLCAVSAVPRPPLLDVHVFVAERTHVPRKETKTLLHLCGAHVTYPPPTTHLTPPLSLNPFADHALPLALVTCAFPHSPWPTTARATWRWWASGSGWRTSTPLRAL